MQRALTFYSTTIGKKVVMAVSGVVMLGFTLGHLSGNLKAFSGAQELNEYAQWLRQVPMLLWATRIAVLAAFVVHFASAYQLWQRNKGARKTRYAKQVFTATDYAARTMYWTGPILFFYILFHLAHLTFGHEIFGDSAMFGIEGYTWEASNPYNNMVYGFQHWVIVVPYVLGVVSFGMHLFHGIWSMFQSIGANHPKYNALRRDAAIAVASLLTIGFLSLPIAVMAGYLEPTTQTFNFPELL